ncbi:MAG TPA: response regulator [Synechococcales cyanobacterium M55_K2018_004]|nr:response regulator [Synechococcales cyanobacterium M55_K2018_004]
MTRRILIIDDEEDIRTIATVALETVGGWDSLSAASGQEGLAIAQAQHPDAILLDVMMPEMDGIEVFQQLQANPSTQAIPVILLTAKVQAADQRKLSTLGAIATIPKPFNPLTLPDEIAAILHW